MVGTTTAAEISYLIGDVSTGDDPAPRGVSMPVPDDFASLSESYRPELLAYCYRMLGSIHDAEDLVQETYLRAWRAFEGFEGRASVRTWLYRIATNACLNALDSRKRRVLPTDLTEPSRTPEAPPAPPPAEVAWLQPIPDALFGSPAGDPAAIVAARSSLRLALVAALQCLPAKQRAVFILREALSLPATEVAELLDTSVPAVKSALQRARAQLDEAAPAEEEVAEPGDPQVRALLDRFVAAFDSGDVGALVMLLTKDVVLEMPPTPSWFAGVDAVARVYSAHVFNPPGMFRLLATAANGQPAYGVYHRGEDGVYRAYAVMVLTLAGAPADGAEGPGVGRISMFPDPDLIKTFALPPVHPGQGDAEC